MKRRNSSWWMRQARVAAKQPSLVERRWNYQLRFSLGAVRVAMHDGSKQVFRKLPRHLWLASEQYQNALGEIRFRFHQVVA